MAVALQALDGGGDQRLTALLGQLALEARLRARRFSAGLIDMRASGAGAGSHATRRSRPRRKSARISRAALWPGAPVTPPPGCVPAPHMYRPAERTAVVAVAEHRARGEQLIETQRAVDDVPADEAEGALEVERTHDLPTEHGRLEVRRVAR